MSCDSKSESSRNKMSFNANNTPHIPIKEYLEVEDQLWKALDQLMKRLPKGHPHSLLSKYERDSIGFLGFRGLFDGLDRSVMAM